MSVIIIKAKQRLSIQILTALHIFEIGRFREHFVLGHKFLKIIS